MDSVQNCAGNGADAFCRNDDYYTPKDTTASLIDYQQALYAFSVNPVCPPLTLNSGLRRRFQDAEFLEDYSNMSYGISVRDLSPRAQALVLSKVQLVANVLEYLLGEPQNELTGAFLVGLAALWNKYIAVKYQYLTTDLLILYLTAMWEKVQTDITFSFVSNLLCELDSINSIIGEEQNSNPRCDSNKRRL